MTHLLRDLIAAGGLRIGRRYRDKHGGYDTATRWHLRFWGCGGIKCELRRPSAIEPLDCHRQTDGHLSCPPGISVIRAQFAMRVPEARTSTAANDAVDPLYQCGERGSKTPVKAG